MLGGVPEVTAQQGTDVDPSGLVSTVTSRRYGLERAWYTHVQINRSRARLQAVTGYVSSTKAHTVYLVEADGRKYYFSERDLDFLGQPIGKDKASKMANDKADRLKAEFGFDAKVETKVVPEMVLYFISNDGVIQAVDGENGSTLWVRTVGRRSFPTTKPGLNEDLLAITNGSTLYMLDRHTGKEIWHREMRGVPGAGPALGELLVHVPMIDGMLETYQLKDPARPRNYFKSHGHALLQPITTPRNVVWATDRGHVYSNSLDERSSPNFRLEATGSITCRPTFVAPDRIVFTSLDGYIYCVDEKSGDLQWQFPTGQPISRSAVAAGKAIYVTTDDGGMFKISVDTAAGTAGKEIWWSPRVRDILSISEKRIYCRTSTGRLVILNADTGGRIATLGTESLDFIFTNTLTDRIYIGDRSGTIQCLRESTADFPLIHSGEAEKPKQIEQVAVEPMGGDKPGAEPAGGENPFGPAAGGAAPVNPFGGGAAAPENPFGPAAGGGAPATPAPTTPAAPDNPFGGANPFGGDNPFGDN